MEKKLVRLYKGTKPKDEGTVVVFGGEVYGGRSDGLLVKIAVDHPMAGPIEEQLAKSDNDLDRVLVEIEDWQIVG